MALGAFLGLEIGKKGVLTSQKALNVVSHNITNAETEGYSRQTIALKASAPLNAEAGGGQVGTGVEFGQIKRIRDQFIDDQVREQNAFAGYVETLSESLGKLQTILNEPSDNNIRSSMDLFFQSLEDLNNQPENNSVRVTVVERAKSLATLINVAAQRLDQSFENNNEEIVLKVDKINSIARELSSMNTEISKVRNTGQSPNDLLDARDLLLDELSKLVNIQSREDSTGTMYVNIGKHLLVQGEKTNELQTLSDPNRPGLLAISSGTTLPEASSHPEVAKAIVGAHAVDQVFTVTVFDTANTHQMQAKSFVNIKVDLSDTSTLAQAGVTSGSFFLNGVQIYFDNSQTVTELKDRINHSGLGVSAYFERGRMVLKSNQTGTAGEIILSEGTSNVLEVFGFSDETEINSQGEIVFEGKVRDARYAYNNEVFVSSSNFIENIVSGVDVELKGIGSTSVKIENMITGGKIKGLLEYQDRYLEGETRNLDKLSYALIKEINKIHFEGFGLDGQSQRLFFKDFASPDPVVAQKGASKTIAVSNTIQTNVKMVAAAGGVFEKEGDRVPVSSGSGDGTNALKLAQLKYAKIVDNGEFGLSTRLSVLNGGIGVDLGRPQSFFVISNGEKNAVVSLKDFHEDSTIVDLQKEINTALEMNGFASKVTVTPQADGTIRMVSSNENLTFLEGAGTTGSDLHLTAASGAFGNGTRIISSSALQAKFHGDPRTVVDFVASIVSNVGVKGEELQKLKANSDVVKTQLENERLSIIGVSIDEELTSMIQYQQGYSASARVINMANQLLETIIGLV